MKYSQKRLEELDYPLFKLPPDPIIRREDGIVFLNGKVLDDTNVDKPTLGLRRLHTSMAPDLHPLKFAVTDEIALFQIKSPDLFIDNLGVVCRYQKSTRAKLKFLVIEDVLLQDTYCLIRLEGLECSFEARRPPPANALYAGVLFLHNMPWRLYCYSENKQKDTWRKI